MNSIIDRIPIDTHTEITLNVLHHRYEPIVGINGHWDDEKVIPMFDFDVQEIPQRVMNILSFWIKSYAILKTQKGYHIIGFVPIDIDLYHKLLYYLSKFGLDHKFIGMTYIRGYPTLRIGKKGDNLPEFVTLINPHCMDGYSWDHYDYYYILFGSDKLPFPENTKSERYPGKLPILQLYW